MNILGIDEVGRGPLAGPLVVGAVILPTDSSEWFADLKDSKQLSAQKRTILSNLILKHATTSLGWVTAKELDQIGISQALRLATHRAVKSIQQLHTPFSQIIIDGNINFLSDTPLSNHTSTLIKADAKIPAVSAASIIAKVARDNYMKDISPKYPEYHFDRHVGYGTKQHIQAIYQYGITPEHRLSFEPCKTLANFQLIKPQAKNTTKKGCQAEQAIADYLENTKGHTIITKNHKTYFYEIDLISTKDNHIYFTEVKYRASNLHGSGFEAITKDKQHKMHFAASSYLKYNNRFKNYQPLLAVASVSGTDYHIDQWFPLT